MADYQSHLSHMPSNCIAHCCPAHLCRNRVHLKIRDNIGAGHTTRHASLSFSFKHVHIYLPFEPLHWLTCLKRHGDYCRSCHTVFKKGFITRGAFSTLLELKQRSLAMSLNDCKHRFCVDHQLARNHLFHRLQLVFG